MKAERKILITAWLIIAAAIIGLTVASFSATQPSGAPSHNPAVGPRELLARIADNTQRAIDGTGVATQPATPPAHNPAVGEKELLARIADNTQDIAATGAAINRDFKVNVRVASTDALTAPGSVGIGASIGGVTIEEDDRVLLAAQADAEENGIWLPGAFQVETATAAGAVSGNGNASVVITSPLVAGSPLTVAVAVTNGDSAATWAGKVRTALAGTAAVTDDFTVGGASTSITLTALLAADNDATLNISLATGTATGITAAPASANTTAGVAPQRATDSDTWDEIAGSVVRATEGGRPGVYENTNASGGTLDTTEITYDWPGVFGALRPLYSESIYGQPYGTLNIVEDYSNSKVTRYAIVNGTHFTTQVFAATIEESDNTVTATGHDFVNGELVAFDTLTGGVGLSINTPYYVVNAATNTFQVSLTVGGAAINVTTDYSAANVNRYLAYTSQEMQPTVGTGNTGSYDHSVFGIQSRGLFDGKYIGNLYGFASIIRKDAGATAGATYGLSIAQPMDENGSPVASGLGTHAGINIASLSGGSTNSAILINGDNPIITGGRITVGTVTQNTCAAIDVTSTTRGLLLPRMTKAQRDAIGTPLAGLAIYQTDNTPGLRVYNGTNWMKYTEATD